MLLKHTILATRQALTNFQFYLKNSSSKTCNNSKNNRKKKKTKPSKEHDTERKRWRWRETNLGFLQRSLKLLIAGKHDPPHGITVGLVGLPLGGLPWGPQPRALPPVFCLQTDTARVSDCSPINKKLPCAASGLTAPVWIHEQTKSKRSVFFQKLFGKNYRPFVGNKSIPGIKPQGSAVEEHTEEWAAKGGQPRGSTSSHGLKASKGKHWRKLCSWGAVCSLPALA